jgi:hypothetical protein
MARRSLKPQLNQIRAWVRQGRTDAWIAHQLEISTTELREFRSQHDLSPDAEDTSSEVDLRDEIEAEIEAAAAEVEEDEEEDEEEEEEEEEDGDEAAEEESKSEAGGAKSEAGDGESRPPRRRRRRGRRGGRGRRKELEATFDHGETDGYGLWLDPAVKENPVYTEHWAGQREVTVRIDVDQIVIRRPGAPEPAGSAGSSSDEDD